MDVVLALLQKMWELRPESAFVSSLLQQYQERGSLSRRQLQGLLNKAERVPSIAPAWLATLQAIIQRMPVRDKTPVAVKDAPVVTDAETERQIQEVLAVLPEHKRVLFFKAKHENKEPLSPQERQELQRFYKHACDKKSG
ncbi:MAG TPA: hypothetical protein PKE63_11955 [Lacibacter sp.]|nr:hypothetical protein [Lacibacter sp.]HMP87983.1 hypothetical protein [Lacibacter sp.]